MSVQQWFNLIHRPWATSLVIAVATALAMPVNGYVYGINDHTYHLARLNWLKDPTLYSPQDPFIQTFDAYTSVFWVLSLPLTNIVTQPLLFLGLYFVAVPVRICGAQVHTTALWFGDGCVAGIRFLSAP